MPVYFKPDYPHEAILHRDNLSIFFLVSPPLHRQELTNGEPPISGRLYAVQSERRCPNQAQCFSDVSSDVAVIIAIGTREVISDESAPIAAATWVNVWKDEAMLSGLAPPFSQVLPMERLASLLALELSGLLWGKARQLLQQFQVLHRAPISQIFQLSLV